MWMLVWSLCGGGLLAEGLPEPGVLFYGSVANTQSGARITSGTVTWTFTTGDPVSTVVVSAPIRDVGGQSFYVVEVPFETVTSGLTLSANTFSLPSSTTTYGRSVKLDGQDVVILDATGKQFAVSAADRGLVRRVDLQFIPSGAPETYEAWSTRFFGIPNADPGADPDGDGRTNLQEFSAGTDPTAVSELSIAGAVRYYASGLTVSNVTFQLTGSATANFTTGPDGLYRFGLLPGESYTNTPSKVGGEPPAQGVSTLDITLLRRHILGLALLDSPYKILAADVNGSATISTLDITFMRRVILGLTNSMPAGSWKFVRSDFVFADPTRPWNAETSRSYAGLTAERANQDFVAIKLGDVNASWTPAAPATSSLGGVVDGGGASEDRGVRVVAVEAASAERAIAGEAPGQIVKNAEPGLDDGEGDADAQLPFSTSLKPRPIVAVGDAFVTPDDGLVSVPITTSQFRHVNALQFSVRWDPMFLSFVDTTSYGLDRMEPSHFGVEHARGGVLTFSWDEPDGKAASIIEGGVLFTLRFRPVRGNRGWDSGSTSIRVTDDPTAREFVQDGELVALDSRDGRVFLGSLRPGPASLSLVALQPGFVRLQVRGAPGVRVALESSSDLIRWVRFEVLGAASGGVSVERVESTARSGGARFYRAVEIVP